MKASHEQAERLHRFAHDLRNRLAAIQQVLGQVAAASDDDSRELIGFAEQQYFKAMRSCEELLDDFGVERGVPALQREAVELSALVQAEIDQLAHRFERKGQQCTLERADAAIVHADAEGIKQIVGALLSNASKFSHRGQRISVSLSVEADHARLDVLDAGIGMDPEDLAQVFTRYALLKGRPTDGEAQGRGTLARARQWAVAHGGSLSAQSDGAGKGACFTLRLPLRPPPAR